MKRIDLTGKKFERLAVTDKAATVNGIAFWNCLCDCGNIVTVRSADLRSGHTKSCGCYNRSIVLARNKERTKHGQATNPLYNVWKNMRNRCNNPNCWNYKCYGGRGITVCEEWDKDVSVFIAWAEENGYMKGLEIDRINVNGNYEPSN